VRDFSIVDQDQSDNVTTTYLVTTKGIAQDTAANAALGGPVQKNGSDERLLTLVDQAVGCSPWVAPNLADPGKLVTALPLNELQAAVRQGQPVALVPNTDPMVLVNGNPDLAKLNAYRQGVDQPLVQTLAAASTTPYCGNLLAIAPKRLLLDQQLTQPAASPDPAAANNLFTFLAQRYVATYGTNNLNCIGLLNKPDPVKITTDATGIAISATITP
jgi:hypothetical protein